MSEISDDEESVWKSDKLRLAGDLEAKGATLKSLLSQERTDKLLWNVKFYKNFYFWMGQLSYHSKIPTSLNNKDSNGVVKCNVISASLQIGHTFDGLNFTWLSDGLRYGLRGCSEAPPHLLPPLGRHCIGQLAPPLA